MKFNRIISGSYISEDKRWIIRRGYFKDSKWALIGIGPISDEWKVLEIRNTKRECIKDAKTYAGEDNYI